MLVRETSCIFVNRALKNRSDTIHEITLNDAKEHELDFGAKPPSKERAGEQTHLSY